METRDSFFYSKLAKGKKIDNSVYFYILIEILGRESEFIVDSNNLPSISLITYDFPLQDKSLQLELTDEEVSVDLFDNFTRFSFKFTEKKIIELYELDWLKKENKIKNICIKIWLSYQTKPNYDSRKNKDNTFDLEKLTNIQINEITPLIFEISNCCYTFPVNIQLKSQELFNHYKKLIDDLKEYPLLEKIFCLKDYKVDDSRRIFTFNEPIEAMNYEFNNEAISYLISIEFFAPIQTVDGRFILINSEITKYAQSNMSKKFYISQNRINLADKNFLDFIQISNTHPYYLTQGNFNLLDPISFFNLYDFLDVNDYNQYSLFKVSTEESNFAYNYFKFKPLRHKNLLRIFGVHKTKNELTMVAEKVKKINFRKDFNMKKKIKVFVELVKFLIYCQQRRFYFIELSADNIFFNEEGEFKVLPNFYREISQELQAPEEKIIGPSDKSEAFRLGLLICKVFFDEDEICSRDNKWLTGNVPILEESIQEKYPKMTQIIVELTNLIPKYRLSLESLLLELENYNCY